MKSFFNEDNLKSVRYLQETPLVALNNKMTTKYQTSNHRKLLKNILLISKDYLFSPQIIYTGCFFYMLSHVSFNYSKTINVTFTSFTNIKLDIGGRLYSESQLTKWGQSISVRVQSWGYIVSLLSRIVRRKSILTLKFVTRSKTAYY